MKENLFLTYFKELEDPRSPINKLHELNTILLIGVIATLCGAETWKQMEEFGKAKQKLIKTRSAGFVIQRLLRPLKLN